MTIFRNDRALLDAFRRGEPEALERVYYFYVDDVFRLVSHGFHLKEHNVFVGGIREIHRQKEIVQEVFARCLTPRARLAYDGLKPFRPYLRRIAMNLMISLSRRMEHQALTSTATEELLDNALEGTPSSEDASMLRPYLVAMIEYLAQLDPISRRFVTLRFEEERSQNEVAQELGLSRRNVRTMEERLRRGLLAYFRRRGFSLVSLRGGW